MVSGTSLQVAKPMCSYCKFERATWRDVMSNGWCATCRIRGTVINWIASHRWLTWTLRKDYIISSGKDAWQNFVYNAPEKDILDIMIRIEWFESRIKAEQEKSTQLPYSSSKVDAIETVYNGYKFRSRLEARWAVFMKELDVIYYYEHEGYPLGSDNYLPDFWLPQLQYYVEIKGITPNGKELRKARLLSMYTRKQVYILAGNVGLPLNTDSYVSLMFDGQKEKELDLWWCECQTCGTIGFFNLASLDNLPCTCISLRSLDADTFVALMANYRYNSSRLTEAYKAARQARFEYGEKP